jgi:hypothetical protein
VWNQGTKANSSLFCHLRNPPEIKEQRFLTEEESDDIIGEHLRGGRLYDAQFQSREHIGGSWVALGKIVVTSKALGS